MYMYSVLAMLRTSFLVQFITFLLRQSPPTFRYCLGDVAEARCRLLGSLACILLGGGHNIPRPALRLVIVPGSGRQARDTAADARQLGLCHVVGGHRAQQPVDRPVLLRAYNILLYIHSSLIHVIHCSCAGYTCIIH